MDQLVLDKKKKIVLQELRQYNRVFVSHGNYISHPVDLIMNSLLIGASAKVSFNEYHCDDVVCKKIMDNYIRADEIVIVKERVSDAKSSSVVLSHRDREMQIPRVYDGSVVDVSYKVDEVNLIKKFENGNYFLLVGSENNFIDCVDSDLEDNLAAKPHHYRRSFAMSYGIDMLAPTIVNPNLCVVDAAEYNFGITGGYFSLDLPGVINVYVNSMTNPGAVMMKVYNFEKKSYFIVDRVDAGQIVGNFRYDKESKTFLSSSYYCHYSGDYDTISPSNINYRRRPPVVGKAVKYDIFVEGVGIGLRKSVFSILNSERVEAIIRNIDDKMNVYVIASTYDPIDHLIRYFRYRGCKFRIEEIESIVDYEMNPMVRILLS